MIEVSVIVPLYRGRKYMDKLIRQVGNAADFLPPKAVELIFINDDPGEQIKLLGENEKIDIFLHTNQRNIGIHASRIKGLSYARGNYILFLDQDDKIYETYFQSQLKAIGKADAIVCNLIHNQEIYYKSPEAFKRSLSRNTMIYDGNLIVTPGQVLIKREAIPVAWTDKVITSNGADDWYLWICMQASGKRLVGNDEVLFEHIVHEDNTSSKSASMLCSMHEVERLAFHHPMLSDSEREGVADCVHAYAEELAKERDSLFKTLCLLDRLMSHDSGCASIANYFRERKIDQLMIYGMGRIGRYLETELSRCGIKVLGFIDRNARNLKGNCKVPEEIETIDCAILVSLMNPSAISVRKELEKRGFGSVYLIEELADRK